MIFFLAFATESDREKFEYLYDRYKNLLMHKAVSILRDHMLAEDAVSEAYLRIYKNLDKIEDPASNRSAAFCVTITKNVALTMLKKRSKETPDAFEIDRPDEHDMELTVLNEITSDEVYTVLGKLDEEARNIFVLKFAYDLPHKEIAKTLGLTENNVTVKLHRAKKRLSEILVKEGYADGIE